jgi:DNA-binding NarL/FixJ family response regulator
MHAGRQCALPLAAHQDCGYLQGGQPTPSVRLVPVGFRCLIVDDNVRFLEAARSSLDRQGIEVVGVAATGADAIARVEAFDPDVVLVDIGLGEESGFELTRRLVDTFPRLRSRVVLISTRGEDEYADMVETSAAVGFVSKSSLSAHALTKVLSGRGTGEAGG